MKRLLKRRFSGWLVLVCGVLMVTLGGLHQAEAFPGNPTAVHCCRTDHCNCGQMPGHCGMSPQGGLSSCHCPAGSTLLLTAADPDNIPTGDSSYYYDLKLTPLVKSVISEIFRPPKAIPRLIPS